MDFQISEALYAERRRARVEKLKQLRSSKNAMVISDFAECEHVIVPEEEKYIKNSNNAANNVGNDKVKNRQIKNRESALLSRKRKMDEMSYLHTKVNSLEEEVLRLRSRLKLYEGDAAFGNHPTAIVIVPNSNNADLDSVSLASTESDSESSLKNQKLTRGRPSYSYSHRSKYQVNLKNNRNNDGNFLNANNNSLPVYHMYPNKCLSHLEPAVFH